MGGENGNCGYVVIDGWRLIAEVAGDIIAAGSSSPKLTPNARNFASANSLQYESHSVRTQFVSILPDIVILSVGER
jgi:hypothetical protein